MFFNGSLETNYQSSQSPEGGPTQFVSAHRLANNNVLIITSSVTESGSGPFRYSILGADGVATSENNFLLAAGSNIADLIVLQNGGFAILTSLAGIPSIVIYGPNSVVGTIINVPAEALIVSAETSAITQLLNGNIALLGSFESPILNPGDNVSSFLGALQILPAGNFISNVPTALAALSTNQIVIEAVGFNALPGDSLPGDPNIINVAFAWHELPSGAQTAVTAGSYFAVADFNTNLPVLISTPASLIIPSSAAFSTPEIDFGPSGNIFVHWSGSGENTSFDSGIIFNYVAEPLSEIINLQAIVDNAVTGTEFDAVNIGQVAFLSDGSLLVAVDAVNGIAGNDQGVIAVNFGLNLTAPGAITTLNSITTIPNNLPGTDITTNELHATSNGFEIFWQNYNTDGNYSGTSSRNFVQSNTPPAPVEFNGGQEYLVNQQTFGAQLDSHIVQLSDGRFIAVWVDQNSGNSGAGGDAIIGRFLAANGAPTGNEFVINQFAAGEQQSVSVAALQLGGFAVAWTSTQTDGNGQASTSNLIFRAFDNQASALSGDIVLAALGKGGAAQTDIAVSSDGTILVGSTRDTLIANPATESTDIVRTALLTRLTGPFSEPTVTTTQISVGAEFPFQNTAVRNIDMLSGGGFVALIETAYGMRVQLLSGGGLYAPQLVNLDAVTTENQSSAVLATANGGFVVFGRQPISASGPAGIYMMRFDALGIPTLLAPVKIADGVYSEISTTLLSSGNIAVAWNSSTSTPILDGGFETINTANVIVINDAGTVIRPVISAIQPENDAVKVTALVADDFGGFGILWQEGSVIGENLPNIDVYFRAFTSGPSNGNDFRSLSEDEKQEILIDVTGNDGANAQLASIVSVTLDSVASRLSGLTGAQVADVSVRNGQIAFQFVENLFARDIDGLRPGETANILVTYALANGTTRVLTITVSGDEDAARLLFNPFNGAPLPENIGVAGQSVLYDADNDLGNITFSIAGNSGVDNNRVTINPTTGVVSFISIPNYENPLDVRNDNIYNIAISATSTSGADAFDYVQISISDVNEQTGAAPVISAPVILAPINEDSGTRVITTAQFLANASDADGNALSIIGLTASTGNLTANNNGTWNYRSFTDQNGPVTFNYRVTDGLSIVDTSAILQINPINDAPSFLNISNRTINDNLANGTVFSVATGSDTDGDVLTYSLTNNAGGRFGINAVTGDIFVANGSLLNGAGTQTVQITVQATDPSGLSRSLNANITVYDADFAALDNVPGDVSSAVAGPIGGSINGAINFLGDRDWYRVDLTAGLTYTFLTGASTLPISGTNEADTVITLRNANGGTITSDNNSGPGNYSFLSFTPSASGTYFIEVNDFGNNAIMDFRLSITSSGVNPAPTVVTAPANIVINEDSLLNQSFNPAIYFADLGDTLTYRFESLPNWLSFTNGALTGTPTNNFVGTRTLALIATDSINQSVTTTFNITVINTNDAPILVNPIANVSTPEDAPFGITLGNASSIFNDPDVDTTLVYVATLQNGDPLPAWLNFNATNFVFSGTPPVNFTGALNVRVTATDGAGLSASDIFVFSVTAVNDAPVTTNSSAMGTEDVAITGTLPASDEDSTTLTYVVLTQPTNGTVVVTANGTYTYTPNANFNGTDSFTFQTNDGTLLSNASTISLTINAVNDAPVIASPLANILSPEDDAVSFILPTNSFTDIEGDILSLSTSALPSWLSFNAATRNFTGTPPANFFGNVTVTVTATDGSGASVSDSFVLAITPVNDAPILANSLASVAEDSAISGILVATDIDSPTLTYSLVSGPSNGTLALNAVTGTYTYTPNANYNGNDSFDIRANDGDLNSGTATISLTVTAANDAAIATDGSASGNEDTAISGTLSATDIDSPALTYAVVTGPTNGTLTLNAATGAYVYTPNANYNGSDSLTFRANDGSINSNVATVNLTVAPVNDAPLVATPLAGQSSTEDAAISFTLPAGSFTDVDNATLTLSATLADGSALPAWLSFNAATSAFAGNPPANFNGALNLKVTATDAGGLSASSTFAMNITPVNDAPVLVTPLVDRLSPEDMAVNFTLPAGSFADVDNTTLSLSARLSDNSALPSWLTFNAATGNFTGTPPVNFNGLVTVTFTATDAGGLQASDTFTINITPVNDAPIDIVFPQSSIAENAANGSLVAFAVGNDLADIGSAVSFSLTDNAGGRFAISTNGDVTVTNGALLNFEAATSHTITIRVTDSAGATYDETFTISVNNVNEAPNSLTRTAGGSIAENSANGAVVALFAATDPDTGAALSYALTDTAGGRFAINATTGQLTVANGALLDFETAASHNVTVRATDQFGLSRDLTTNISITDVADGTPINVVTGTNGSNFLFATAGADQILALDGNDFVFGLGGNDTLDGGNGNDWLDGGTGNDIMLGGAGRDTLYGGSGDDIIIGGAGSDLMIGGTGQDIFRFLSTGDSTSNSNGRDSILDFNSTDGPNHDLIDLSAIDANTNAAGNQAFTFIGNGAFTNVAGQLRYTSGNGRLSADVNGDGRADFSVDIIGSNPFIALQLDATDFVL